MVARGFLRRCPSCGGGGLFRGWFRIEPRCPTCGLELERGEPGYQVGAYLLNIAVSELGAVALLGGIAAGTWPHPPWDLLLWGGVTLVIVLPILFYPVAKTLFLAMDLIVRPRGHE